MMSPPMLRRWRCTEGFPETTWHAPHRPHGCSQEPLLYKVQRPLALSSNEQKHVRSSRANNVFAHMCCGVVPWGTPHACTTAHRYMFATYSDVGVGTLAVKNEVDISENVTVPACSSRGSYRGRSSYRGLFAPACPML